MHFQNLTLPVYTAYQEHRSTLQAVLILPQPYRFLPANSADLLACCLSGFASHQDSCGLDLPWSSWSSNSIFLNPGGMNGEAQGPPLSEIPEELLDERSPLHICWMLYIQPLIPMPRHETKNKMALSFRGRSFLSVVLDQFLRDSMISGAIAGRSDVLGCALTILVRFDFPAILPKTSSAKARSCGFFVTKAKR